MGILSCFNKIYSSKEIGLRLSHLIPTAGAMIFPLLAENDEAGKEAFVTIQIMLSINSDALWRSIVTASCKGYPDRVLHAFGKDAHLNQPNGRDLILAQRAIELTNFMKRQPEQNLI